MAEHHRRISSGSAFEAQIGYSRAVVSDEWIFVSGCTGYDYASGQLRSGVVDQADQALRNIAAALAQAGADDSDPGKYELPTMADVVRVRYILPDRALFPATWPVLRRWLGGPGGAMPAATMIQAGLLEAEMLIEIEVTVRRRKRQAPAK